VDANTVGFIADTDVERLHLVLVYRAVGLPLDEIRTLLDDPDVDVSAHLRRQHRLLLDQSDRLAHTIKAVEELMDAHRSGIRLTAQEQVEIFGTDAFGGEYAEEAERRWGDTDAWKQSRRVAQMSKQGWIDVKAEGDALLAAQARAKRDGVQPGSPEAEELVERHRAQIERFYEFGGDMHRNLVEMYVADERFTKYYDDVEPGLARFVRAIVVASIEA
jgi:DNA-binding transcriptional MerR regulator